MNISSAAGYLINRAVRLASDLQQESKGNASRSTVPAVRAKSAENVTENNQVTRRSNAAYRVSLSSSAMQRQAMEGLSA